MTGDVTGDVTPPPPGSGGAARGLRVAEMAKSCFTVGGEVEELLYGGGEVAWAARNAADLCEQRGEEAHLVAAPHALRRVHGA